MPTTPLVHLRWFITLAHRLLRVTPGITLLVITATLVAQAASVLAFFLPLKVLLLLGSPGVPRYFPAFFADLDRNFLIILLTSATGVFYLLHLLCERIISLASAKGAILLEQRAGKLQMFDGQQQLLLNAYRLFSRCASSAVFVVLAFLLLAHLYPLIAGWFLLFLLCGWLLGWLAGWLPWLGHQLQGERLVQSISVWGSLGFLGGFAWLVVDFSLSPSQGLLASLIAMLLSRQMFRHTEVVAKNLVKLNERRDQYEALFIYHRPLTDSGIRQKDRQKDRHLWRYLLPANRSQWLAGLNSDLLAPFVHSTDFQWHDSGTPGVFVVHPATAAGQSAGQPVPVLVIYEKNREGMSRKEAELLNAMHAVPEFPALPLVECLPVDDGRLHVFAVPAASRFLGLLDSARATPQLRCQLLMSAPPAELVSRYQRSTSMLPSRLDNTLLERLQLACDDAEKQHLLKGLMAQLDELVRRLQAMPLAIMLGTRPSGPVVRVPAGQCYLTRWEHWALEPAGAGWPFAEHDIKRYAAILELARHKRPDLATVNVQHLYLAAATHGFERACQRQAYRKALEILPQVLAALNRVITAEAT